jgi:glyceraldehyde-3-phosphate dehydrogenase/erythrose-4-phosphate dehydrogenase
MRVPILTGSVIVFNVNTIKKATKEEINEFFKNNTSQYLEYNDEALVSIDIKANPHSAIFDPTMTSVAPD